MSVRIIIMRQGSGHILHEWEEEEDGGSNLFENRWEAAARLWPAGMLNGFNGQPEIFLCLHRETLAEGYETDFLGRVIDQAHASMWGANLYVVVDKRLLIDDPDTSDTVRKVWFGMLLEKGISDVLKLDVDFVNESAFRRAAVRSTERLRVLRRHPHWAKCKCLLLWEPQLSPYAASFLEDFLTDTLPDDSSNCLIVLRDCTHTRLEFVRDSLKGKAHGKILVALLDELDESELSSLEGDEAAEKSALQELKQLCKDHTGQLIVFHGLFELHYFLQRLNTVFERHRTILQYAEIVSVRESLFSPHAPQLLITHAFNPSDPTSSLAAARDVHTLRREFGDRFEIVVHPAMQSQGFRDTLSEAKQMMAWVHIGHGNETRGLQQADGLFKTAEEWISCFAGHEGSLSLAVFSSCESDIIAREFAGAGVGVTIGFRKRVPKTLCGEMGVTLVKAAFESSGNRDRILDAFRRAKGMFADAEPVIFCARH